jgi:hypothetical protein
MELPEFSETPAGLDVGLACRRQLQNSLTKQTAVPGRAEQAAIGRSQAMKGLQRVSFDAV